MAAWSAPTQCLWRYTGLALSMIRDVPLTCVLKGDLCASCVTGEDLQTQNIEKCFTEKQMRTSLMATASEMETRIEELHAAIRTGKSPVMHYVWVLVVSGYCGVLFINARLFGGIDVDP